MDSARRDAFRLALASAGVAALPGAALAATTGQAGQATAAPRWRAGIEGQRRGDLGDGSFLNPVLSGDRPDPMVYRAHG